MKETDKSKTLFFLVVVYFSVLDTTYCRQKYTVVRVFHQYIVANLLSLLLTDIALQNTYMDYFSLYFIRHSKNFLSIMWNGPKSEENCEMLAQSYAAFALCTMTVKYEELTSTQNDGKRKHCLILLPGSLSSPNRRLTDVY
jgi:hypothetical protein